MEIRQILFLVHSHTSLSWIPAAAAHGWVSEWVRGESAAEETRRCVAVCWVGLVSSTFSDFHSQLSLRITRLAQPASCRRMNASTHAEPTHPAACMYIPLNRCALNSVSENKEALSNWETQKGRQEWLIKYTGSEKQQQNRVWSGWLKRDLFVFFVVVCADG